MTGLWIAAVVLAILFLVGQVRVGVRGEYTAHGITAWIRLGPVHLKVWPRKAAKQKPAREKKEQKPKKESGKETQVPAGGALEYVRELLPLALEAAGQFRQKLQVDHLELVLRAGAHDPADAAMVYGYANAALGGLWLPLTEAFHVKDGRARVELDFESEHTTLYALGAMSIKVGQALWLGLYFGLKGLSKLAAVKGRRSAREKERKAV